LKFFDSIINKIQQIPLTPYMYRQNALSSNDKTREMIFNSYTVPFYIDAKNSKIIVLGIFSQNIWQ